MSEPIAWMYTNKKTGEQKIVFTQRAFTPDEVKEVKLYREDEVILKKASEK